MIDKAIILAAGLGGRISGVSREIAKPFLPIDAYEGEVTFIDWHLRALHRAGVREIYLVGNNATCGKRVPAMDDVPVNWFARASLSPGGSAYWPAPWPPKATISSALPRLASLVQVGSLSAPSSVTAVRLAPPTRGAVPSG